MFDDKMDEVYAIYFDRKEAIDFTDGWVPKNKGKQGKPVQAFFEEELIYTFPSAYYASKYLGISSSSITACCKGRIKGAGKVFTGAGSLVWKYLNPEDALPEKPDWGENLNFRQFIRTFTAGPKEFQFYARQVKSGGEIGKILDKFGEDDILTYTALDWWYESRMEYLISLWWGYEYYKWQLSGYEQSYKLPCFYKEKPTHDEALTWGRNKAKFYLGFARAGTLSKTYIPALSEEDIKHKYAPPSICWGHYPKPSGG